MVDSLTEEFRSLVARYLQPICRPVQSDGVGGVPLSGSPLSESDASCASDCSNKSKSTLKTRVPDPKKRGGLMKLAQAFAGHQHQSLTKSIPAANVTPTAASNKVKLKTEDVWDTPDSSEAESKHSRKQIKLKVYSSFFIR